MNLTDTDIAAALQQRLPAEHHPALAALAQALAAAAGGAPAASPAPDPQLAAALRALAGQEVQAGAALIAFGAGAQLGDVAIGDVAGRDVVKLHIELHQTIGAQQVINAQAGATIGSVIGPQTNYYNTYAAPIRSAQEQRNRRAMLQKVKAIWVDGLLHDSLAEIVRIDLGLTSSSASIDIPFTLQVQELRHAQPAMRAESSLLSAYDRLNGSLLILGSAGAGKTTLLLELTRDLLLRAEGDELHPIPVVFNLSSWADHRSSIDEWMITELIIKYSVPKKIAREWVKGSVILPLLDGLDEVLANHREACVDAINTFQRNHMVPLVVCCRLLDYDALRNKLRLHGAITVQPLSSDQVSRYLGEGGQQTQGLAEALGANEELRGLVSTPLILHILTLAYRNKTKDTILSQYQRMWQAYISAMWKRRRVANTYRLAEYLRRIRWIARNMQGRQSIFYIEALQPSWLGTFSLRAVYFGLVVLLSCFILVTALLIWLPLAATIPVLIGLVSALFLSGSFFVEALAIIPFMSLLGILLIVFAPLVVLLVMGLLILPKALSQLFFPDRPRSAIQPQETIVWSWRRGAIGFVGGIVAAFLSGSWLHTYLASFTNPSLPLAGLGWKATVLSLSLAIIWLSTLVAGLSTGSLSTRSTPNEGMRRSMLNSVRLGLGGGLVIASTTMGLFFVGTFLDPQDFAWLFVFGLPPQGWSVLVVIPMCVGPILGFIFGGYTLIQHFVLRAVLYATASLPWRLQRFLDHCVDRLFLRRVGGGYIFTHRLLMEHFAAMADEDIRQLSEEIEAGSRSTQRS